MRHAYPVFIDLERKPCLVIGGGRMGEERIQGLLDAGAEVTLISPRATERLSALAEEGKIRWLRREYAGGDAVGFFLVIIACRMRGGNRGVFEEAERLGALVNSVDDPECCRFFHPSVHRQGDLVIAVSTSGKCPALAVKIREQLAAEFGPEYAELLRMAGELREKVKHTLPDFEQRRRFWRQLLESPILDDIRAGELAAASRRAEETLRGAS